MSTLPHITGRDLPPLAYAHHDDHDPAMTQPQHFRPITGRGTAKPQAGGLWTAPITQQYPDGLPSGTAWTEWCRAVDWGVWYYTRLTEILPQPDARVLRIDSQADLAAIVDAFPASLGVPGLLREYRYPDWPALAAAGWDAVYLTEAGQWATHLPPVGPELYTWDLATVLWLRQAYSVGRTVVAAPAVRAGEPS